MNAVVVVVDVTLMVEVDVRSKNRRASRAVGLVFPSPLSRSLK